MFKNVASQKIVLLAIDTATGGPKTGDSANLTAYVSKDDGSVTVLGDTSATEIDATNAKGSYSFDLTQSETNADKLYFSGKSSTSGVILVPLTVFTRPSGFGDLTIANNAVASNVTRYGGTAGTFSGGRPEVNASHIAGSAVSTTTAQIGVNVVNFGGSAGTFASGRPEVNTSHLAGSAVDATAGLINANVKQISTDATAADNAEAFFDGTGYAGTNNVIPTVTTLTNAPSDSSGVTTLLSRLSALRAGYLDNLSAGAVALASSLTSVASDVTSILGKFTGITLLAQWLGLIAGKQTGNSTARTELRATGAGSGGYDETTDSLEAVRDRGDAAWADSGTPPTVGAIADAVWEEAIADHSGTTGSTAEALGAAGSAGDPWATALPGAYGSGSAGNILGNNLNATVSSRLPTSSYVAPLDAAGTRAAVGLGSANLDTQLDALPTNAELATALAAADDAVLAAIAALNNLSQANIRTAVGLASANLDTQLDALPTNAELATALAAADDAVLAAIAALNNLSQANIRTAVGLATANLDTQLDALPTNAELATALAAADDAVLAAIAALNNLSAAQVNAQVVDALAVDTYAEPGAVPAATATLAAKINFLAALARNRVEQTSTTQTLKNDAGSGDIATAAVSDDGTTFVRAEWQ